MDFKLAEQAKQIIAMGLAVVILAAIFVPFQRASAFTLTTSLPDASGNVVTQNVSGEDFRVTITVAAGELISISSIQTIIDNTQSTVKLTRFGPSGQYIGGSLGAIKDNTLTVQTPSSTTSAYGYGFGLVSNGYSFSAPYSYSFTYNYAYIAGNNVGYSNVVGNNVSGYVGPATITISGKLNTGLMSSGVHTLDVLINTGVGTNPDELVSPQISFTVTVAPQITTEFLPKGTFETIISTVTGNNVRLGGTFGSAGNVVIQEKSSSTLNTENPGIFSAVGTSSSFVIGSSSGNTAGTIFDIDVSALSVVGQLDVTIPYDPAALPAGFNEANVKFFHWNGAAWEDVTISVDTVANTVTGRVTSLSPVVAGYTSSAPVPGGNVPGGGGGGGTGGSSSVDLTPTYPDSYFVNNPLAKVQLQSTTFVGANGQAVAAARTGGQIDIQATFKNYQQGSQNYAIITQVIDKDGFTADVGWVTGTLASGETTNAARSWVAGDEGNYTVRIFVWDGISQTPTALSIVNDKTLTVVS